MYNNVRIKHVVYKDDCFVLNLNEPFNQIKQDCQDRDFIYDCLLVYKIGIKILRSHKKT